MKNEKIAELVAKKVYGDNSEKTDFAIQLLIEKLVLAKDIASYTELDMKEAILNVLKKK